MSSETTPEGVALLPMTSAPDRERERSYSYGSSSSPVVTLGPGDLQRAVLPAESDGKEEDSSCSDVTVRVLSTAVVTIVINMIQAVSFGNLLLPRTPRLDAARPIAITSYLLSVSTAQYAASWRSGLPFLSGGAAYELLPLLLAMGNGLVDALADAPDDELVATTFAGFALVSLALALWYRLTSAFSSSFRLVPLVALKGALAGVGLFLAKSAWETLHEGLGGLDEDGGDVVCWRALAISAALALGLFLGDLALKYPPFVTLFLMLIVVVFNVVASLAPDLLSEAWFFPPGSALSATSGEQSAAETAKGLAAFYEYAWLGGPALSKVRWKVLFTTASTWSAVLGSIFTHQIAVLMDLVNLEAITKAPLELTKELPMIGTANFFAGLASVLPNYCPISNCLLTFKLAGGMRTPRWLGILTASVTALSTFCVTDLVGVVPRPMVACYFLWLSAIFIDECVIQVALHGFHYMDIVVIVGMALTMVFVGFVQGLALGTIAACLTFAMYYGEFTSPVRNVLSGQRVQGNSYRPQGARALLRSQGFRIQILDLQGFLYFGSMPRVLERSTAVLTGAAAGKAEDAALGEVGDADGEEKSAPLKLPGDISGVLIVRMKHVAAVDYSAAYGFTKLRRNVAESGWRLVLSDMAPQVESVLQRTGCLFQAHDGNFLVNRDGFYRALLDAEESLLDALGYERPQANPRLMVAADQAESRCLKALDMTMSLFLGQDLRRLQTLRAYWRRATFDAGAKIWVETDVGDSIVLVTRGRCSTHQDGGLVEYNEIGSLVGYLSFFTRDVRQRSLEAISSDVEMLILERPAWEKLRKKDPDLAHAVTLACIDRSNIEYHHHCSLVSLMGF